jgi:GNAT superfamily N-acetyltransferase
VATQTDFAVRQLTVGDRKLWAAYLRFYRATVNDEVTEPSFVRLSTPADGMFAFVAEAKIEKGLVGFAHCVVHPSTWAAADYCYVEDLYVSPVARGTEVTRRLVDAVYAEADRRGCARVYWQTQEFNAPARSFYDTVAHPTSFIVYQR